MAAYHLTWDLGYLRLTPENVALSPLGRVAAHVIAGTFLGLVGIGLVLMNGRGVRARATIRRLARVGGAAALITLATIIAFPDSYIFFGILHCIAVSSVLALPFLFLPAAVTAAAGAFVVAMPHLVAHPLLDAPGLFFLGLGRLTPQTNDYVPLFPWFGIVLFGVALGRVGAARLRAVAARPLATAERGRARGDVRRTAQPRDLPNPPAPAARPATGVAVLTGPIPGQGWRSSEPTTSRPAPAPAARRPPAGSRPAARGTPCARRDCGRRGARLHRARAARAQGLSQRCYEASEGSAPPP